MALATTTPPANPLLDAALAYAARGIPIFPLRPRDKVPVIAKNEGGQGFKDATTDEETIRAWWRRWPQANIGTPTGLTFTREPDEAHPDGEVRPASGWLVIDVDNRHGATYDGLAAQGPLPKTLTAQTGSGGLHLVFGYPEGHHLDQGNNKLGVGYDVKGEGGYIVLAPSVHPSGGMYEWVNDKLYKPAPTPTWVIKRLTPTPVSTTTTTATTPRKTRKTSTTSNDDRDAYWLDWALSQSGPGTGDATGYKLAQQLYLDPNVRSIDGVLQEYARRATLDPSDPFDDRSIDRWVTSASKSRIVLKGEPAKSQRPKRTTSTATTTVSTTASTRTAPASSHRDQAVPEPDGPDEEPASAYTRPPLRLLSTDLEDDDDEEEDEDGEIGGGSGEPPNIDDLLLKGEADDNGNAEAMYRLFGREFLFTPAYGWLRWTGTHWREIPEAEVTQYAIITLKRRRHAAVEADNEAIIKTTKADRSRVVGCLTLFKSYVVEPNVAVFDADPDALNCQNGVLHLRTGEVTPHDPAQRFTYCLPVSWNPDADMTAWVAFILDGLGGDREAAHYLQLCAGYSLTGHTQEEKLFYLHGPSRAGKGTTTETLLALLPKPLSTEVDFASFTARRENDSQNFDLAELKASRLVIASESNRHQSLNPAKVKQLTGGNEVRCAFKHKDMFSYRPQFKVWLVSNWPLNADADDEAAWGRVQVFTFPNSHLGSEDVTLKRRMKSRDNLEGVLRWAVEGAMAWYGAGRLVPPASVVKATKAHRDAQDYMQQWVDECCTLDAERWTTSAALNTSYQEWCKANNIKPHHQTDFAETLIRRFGCESKRGHGGVRGYKGISVQPRDEYPV